MFRQQALQVPDRYTVKITAPLCILRVSLILCNLNNRTVKQRTALGTRRRKPNSPNSGAKSSGKT